MAFSEFFHQSTKRHENGRPEIPHDYAAWPKEWKTIRYKTYPDLEHIALERSITPKTALIESIRARRSTRLFKHRPVSRADLARLLLYSCGIQETIPDPEEKDGAIHEQHRAQPSGGGHYPIEAYVINFVEGEVPAGVFHYNVKDHALDVLERRTFSEGDISSLFVYPFVQQASCAIVLTAVFNRTQAKYGERGYRYILIEAGHIGQNISLVSHALGLEASMMGGSVDEHIEALLDIDGVSESLVYTAVVGA